MNITTFTCYNVTVLNQRTFIQNIELCFVVKALNFVTFNLITTYVF